MPLIIHLLGLVTLISFCSPTFSHFVDPTVAAFPINPTASESRTVHLPAPSTTTCTFTYRTSPPSAQATVVKQRVELADVLAPLHKPGDERGECMTMTANFWEYELCFGSGIKQHKSGDQYSLGRQREVKDTTLVYTGGDQCITHEFNGPRETTVKFACDPTATSLRLIDISEPTTCHYQITATTNAVCGDERYPAQASGATGEDRATEDWFMEVTSLYGDESRAASTVSSSGTGSSHPVDVMCSVYSLEPRAKQSELNFQQWEVVIDRGNGVLQKSSGGSDEKDSDVSVRQARSELVLVRHPGRRRMYDDEYAVEYEENVHRVKNSNLFTGQLAYIKLYA